MEIEFNDFNYSTLDLLNQKVVIKSMSDNAVLLESTIVADNKAFHTIEVKTNNPDMLKKIKSVYVDCILEDGPIQFQGKVRKEYLSNSVIIAIAKGTKMQLREHKRYDSKIPTTINSVFIDGQEIIFNKPLEANIVDLSAAGIALEAPPLAFYKGDIFAVQFIIAGETFKYNYQVMRVQPSSLDITNYGCKIAEV